MKKRYFIAPIVCLFLLVSCFGSTIQSSELEAEFAYVPKKPRVGEEVTFYDGSMPGKGEIVLRKWDFDNDGEWDAYGSQVTYRFTQAENYVVTLMVVDEFGENSTISKIVSVRGMALPSGYFSWTVVWQILIAVGIAVTLIVFTRRKASRTRYAETRIRSSTRRLIP